MLEDYLEIFTLSEVELGLIIIAHANPALYSFPLHLLGIAE